MSSNGMNQKVALREALAAKSSHAPLLERHPSNPILTGAAFPAKYHVKRVFNSGVIKFGTGPAR
jgi:hypothetical protein